MPELPEALAQVPLFAGLSDRDRKRVAKQMSSREFPAGREIISQGGGGVGFFLIEEGSAEVTVDGRVQATLGPGDYFGEIALIDGGVRSATITATTPLRCSGLTSWEFRPLVQSHPELAWPLIEALVARLRAAEARAGAAG